MKTIAELRKAIKPLGFKVKTKQLSWGPHATYVHIASGQELTFNVFTPELLERWKPLFDWRDAHGDALNDLYTNTGVVGLRTSGKD